MVAESKSQDKAKMGDALIQELGNIQQLKNTNMVRLVAYLGDIIKDKKEQVLNKMPEWVPMLTKMCHEVFE